MWIVCHLYMYCTEEKSRAYSKIKCKSTYQTLLQNTRTNNLSTYFHNYRVSFQYRNNKLWKIINVVFLSY